MLPRFSVLAAAAFAAAALAAGCALERRVAPPEMVTDRPDFTESPSIVPRGHVQLETGYTYARETGGKATQSYPEALARIGVAADRLELRLGQSLATIASAGDHGVRRVRTTGAEDFYASAKLRLADERDARPEIAVILQSTLPTGSEGFSADRVLPGVNVVYGWEVVPDFLSLSGSTQGNLALDGSNEGYVQLTQSISVGYSLTKRLGAFTEWYASFPTSRRAGVSAAHTANGGVALKLSPRAQWDIRAGLGLTKAAEDFFVGSGFSLRY